MFKSKRGALVLLFLMSSYSYARNDVSTRASLNMEEGIQVNESIVNFLEARPCEFGIRSDCDRPLSLRDIQTLKSMFKRLDDWNKVTFDEIVPVTDHLRGMTFEISKGNSFSIREVSKPLSKEKYLKITIGNDSHSIEFLKDVRISAASHLVMYDSLFKLSHILAKAKKIRAILEYDIGPDSRILNDTFKRGMSEKNWSNIQNHMKLLEKVSQFKYYATYFEQYIAQSFTASKIKDRDFNFRMKNVLLLGGMLTQTQAANTLEKIAFKLSQIFGNTVGQVQTRSGKLKALATNSEWVNSMKSKLRPLDMLLEKTPFRLTDHFIPGHYGHVAIWLGSPEEVLNYKVTYEGQEISLLDHPLMFPHLERLSQGKLILEALREPGVTMNTLEHFMDIDDFLVLRSESLENPGEKILMALKQFGKPYDFGFDVETENAIVCSELIYMVYDDQYWPTDRSMGRHTISPDHVAWKAIDGCLDPVVLYHDGLEVTQDKTNVLRGFLEQRGGIVYTPTGSCH